MFNLFASSALAPMMAEAVPLVWWLAPIGSIAALIAAYYFYTGIMKESEGTPEMREIAQAVREGAMAYLVAQYRVVGVVFAALFIIFLIMSFAGVQDFWVTIAFLTAGFFSGAAGFIGMRTATNASARTANAAQKSLNDGLRVAFRAGAVMGLTVVGFILLDSSIWFLLLYYVIQPAGGLATVTSIMLSAAVGASTMALFGRVGGGIYTKAADVGADLVGKVEAGIPEDDPRNPATIADNVGDNVGDVAGMGADLYESYLASILSTAALGVAAATAAGSDNTILYITAPFMLAGVGVLISILGVFRVRAEEGATMKQLLHALEGSTQLAGVLIAVAAFLLLMVLGLPNYVGIWVAVVAGLASGMAIGRVTEYYTSADFKPTQHIAEQAKTGPATVIIQGLAVGMESAAIPVIIIVIGTAVAFFGAGGGLEGSQLLDGLFGVGMAAVGMLSTLGLTLATDAYGPVADNAGGNAESMEKAILLMQKAVVQGSEGLTTYPRAFERLGLSVDELKSLSPEQQFEMIAKSIASAEDQQEALTAAIEIFGQRNAPRLIEVFKRLDEEGYGKMAKDIEKAYGIMDEETQKKLDAAADRIERFKNKITVLSSSL